MITYGFHAYHVSVRLFGTFWKSVSYIKYLTTDNEVVRYLMMCVMKSA